MTAEPAVPTPGLATVTEVELPATTEDGLTFVMIGFSVAYVKLLVEFAESPLSMLVTTIGPDGGLQGDGVGEVIAMTLDPRTLSTRAATVPIDTVSGSLNPA